MSESAAVTDLRGWRTIVPRRGVFEIPWGDLWRYRDLILLMALRDLSASYKQTVLGPLWFVLQPLMATAFFSFLFGRMANLGTDHIPHLLFYFSGLTLWNYLSECVNKTSITFNRNANLFGKVYFPRLAMPIATAITALATLLVQFAIFLTFLAFYMIKGAPVHPNWRVVFLPLFVLQLALLGLGLGCMVAALSTKYRDLTLGVGFAVQLWMYAVSIIFPLSRINPHDRWIFLLNPVVSVVEGFRFAFLGVGAVEKYQLALSFAVCTSIFLLGVALFNRAEQTAMDSV